MNVFHFPHARYVTINGLMHHAVLIATNLTAGELAAAKKLGLAYEVFVPAAPFELETDGYKHTDDVTSLCVLKDDAHAHVLHDAHSDLVAKADEDPDGTWTLSLGDVVFKRRFRTSGAAVALINKYHRRGLTAHLVEIPKKDE